MTATVSEKNLTFSAALVRLKKGDEIARKVFGKGDHLSFKEGEMDDETGNINFVESNGEAVAWIPTQNDLLSDDWFVSKEADDIDEDEDEDE